MSRKITFKKSSVVGKVPTTQQLEIGEIALNLADKKIYSKNAQNEIIDFCPISRTEFDDLVNTVNSKIANDDYATETTGGTIKMRLDGTTLYITNDGTNP